jgi:hypothetical protein
LHEQCLLIFIELLFDANLVVPDVAHFAVVPVNLVCLLRALGRRSLRLRRLVMTGVATQWFLFVDAAVDLDLHLLLLCVVVAGYYV